MNILLINHYAGSPKLGMEFRPYFFARNWENSGHHVSIIASSFAHLRASQPIINANFTRENIDNIKYYWVKGPVYKGNGLKRIFNIFSFVLKLIFKYRFLANEIRPDAVIASSTYPLDIFPAYLIARRTKAKLVFEIHDLWPLSPMELGGYSKWHPFIVLMQIAENFAYRYSDKVISILPKTMDHAVSHGLSKEKWFNIPNGIDIEEWSSDADIPVEHHKEISDLRIKNKIIVGYIGGHAISNALNYLIEAAAVVTNPVIHFVLVGDGIEKEGLINEAARKKLNNISFLPPIPKKAVPKLLSFFDYLYIGWQNKPLYRFGISPNKIMDYMMAGKPIIHAVSAGNDPVKEANCGISINPEDPKAIKEAIEYLQTLNSDQIKEFGINARNYVERVHDYKILAQQFINVIQ